MERGQGEGEGWRTEGRVGGRGRREGGGGRVERGQGEGGGGMEDRGEGGREREEGGRQVGIMYSVNSIEGQPFKCLLIMTNPTPHSSRVGGEM